MWCQFVGWRSGMSGAYRDAGFARRYRAGARANARVDRAHTVLRSYVAVAEPAIAVALHALQDRQAVVRERGPSLARRVASHHDEAPFEQRDDIVTIELDLFRRAMDQEQRGKFMSAQHIRLPVEGLAQCKGRTNASGAARANENTACTEHAKACAAAAERTGGARRGPTVRRAPA
ncbi:hypothetical protein WS68_04035 [Burkholderia sp. TSV86]|nr:hypothetical protein WS68_04035 [Burkholderia sp. TSV86]